MCSERDGESATPKHPVLTEFKDALFSLIHLCQAGSLGSSSAPSPRDGSSFSRAQSIVSDKDFSCVPPEEPEWLSKVAAARAYNRALSGRSRPASRRDSGLSAAGGGRGPGGGGGGGPALSPLRNSLSVAASLALEDAAAAGGGAPSPRALDTTRQELFDRFGSFEGLSAALEDFYHRLCSDDRVGATIKQVPEQDVWLTMTQLMALSLQQRHEEVIHASQPEDRQMWIRRCQELLQRGGGGGGGGGAPADEAMDEQGTAAVYDAVMANLMATLERLGALGAPAAAPAGADDQMEQDDELAEAGAIDLPPAPVTYDSLLPPPPPGAVALAAAAAFSEAQRVR